MKVQKKVFRTVVAVMLAINLMVMPVLAADDTIAYVEPRFNNIAAVTLTIGFDANYVDTVLFRLVHTQIVLVLMA